MDLRQLKYFVAVARLLNFTKAAQELNIAQPPLSRQIQLLEEELGVILIHRDVRPIKLSQAGRIFHDQALQILGRVETMRDSTRRVGLQQNSVFSIGFVASTLYGGLPILVRKLRKTAPEIDIRLIELFSVQQASALKEGRIDVGFGRLHPNDPHVVSTTLREERLILAVPPYSILAAEKKPITLAELSDQTVILYPKEPRPSYADHVMALIQSENVRPAEIMMVREIQVALGLVSAESGVCIIPTLARQMRPDLVYRPIASERATSPIIMNYREGDTSPNLELIRSLLRELYEENQLCLNNSD